MIKVKQVKALEPYRIWIQFEDGVSGEVDLSHLAGHGVFSIWSDKEKFSEVRVGDCGEIVWGKNIDLCPDSLYLKITGKKPEEIFKNLSGDLHCA